MEGCLGQSCGDQKIIETEATKSFEVASECTECGLRPWKVVRQRKYFCPQCWAHHCKFRFRKRLYELAKLANTNVSRRTSVDSNTSCITRIFDCQECVLIYYDCSPWSKALLNLVRETILADLAVPPDSKLRKTHLPLPFTFKVLFIYGVTETGNVKPLTSLGVGSSNDLDELRSWLYDTKAVFGLDLPLFVTSLEKSLPCVKGTKLMEITGVDTPVYLPLDPNLNIRIVDVVGNLKSLSSRADLLQCFRQSLIVSIARELNLSKVLLPDQQSTMSVKMFSMMSLGRGAHIADQMSFMSKVEGIELARPMLDLTEDDLFEYLNSLDMERRLNRTGTVLKNKGGRIVDIRSQCEQFIMSLQKEYPGTVPTLTKIGAKLDCNSPFSSLKMEKCRLCKQRLDLEAIETIDFCYACSNIFKEMKDPSLFLALLDVP